MRIEQRKDNVYIKKPDKIEAYTLRVIQRFFETNDELVNNSRESIIQEALRRMRSETLNSIQKVVIEETKKYADTELNIAIESKLQGIIQKLYDEVYKIKNTLIAKEEFQADINNITYEVTLPQGIKIVSDKDIIDVYLNGMLTNEYKFVNDSDGYVRRINFEPNLLIQGDVVYVRCLILHR